MQNYFVGTSDDSRQLMMICPCNIKYRERVLWSGTLLDNLLCLN